MAPPPAGRQRIDKWLFFARVVKSRSLAAKLAASGQVRVNREKIGQASHLVKTGDVLTIAIGQRVLVYKIVDPGTRRGPAEEARRLYENLRSQTVAGADSPTLRESRKESTSPEDHDFGTLE